MNYGHAVTSVSEVGCMTQKEWHAMRLQQSSELSLCLQTMLGRDGPYTEVVSEAQHEHSSVHALSAMDKRLYEKCIHMYLQQRNEIMH